MGKKDRVYTKLLLVVLMTLSTSACFGAKPTNSSIAYTKAWINKVAMKIVTVNLNDPDICLTPAVAKYGIGSCETFRSMIRRTKPAAAIDGTFFCTRTFRPTGSIVIDGKLVARGCMGNMMAIDYYNRVSFIPQSQRDRYKWYDYENVMTAGPTLLKNSEISVYPRAEGFRSSVHFSKRNRAAVGITKHNKLLMVITKNSVYLSRLAKAMKSLNCVDAAVLDGGSSSGLYCNGKLICNPSRAMTNCLLVYENQDTYLSRKYSLNPSGKFVSSRDVCNWDMN